MKRFVPIACTSCLAAILVACNLPTVNPTLPTSESSKPPAAASPSSIPPTATQISTHLPTGTAAVDRSTPSLPSNPPTVQPVPTAQAVLTPTQVCDRASPGNPIDITVPDGSSFEPGQVFTKTWRLLNTGSCTWTVDYSATWFSGEKFGAAPTVNLSGSVAPGKSIDISIDMAAPAQPGTYQSNWKLQDKAGVLFGIGPSGDAPFWVRIEVLKPVSSEQAATSAPTTSPLVYATGFANLTVNDGLDLDRDQINSGKSDDLLYQEQNAAHTLAPQSGTLIAQFGLGQPSIGDCQAAALSTDPQALDQVTAGMYYCYKTSMGLPGWLRLGYLNPNDHVLTVEILTWSTP
jgi:hypothetical protein